ncbi:MAG TPA: ABC transporter ATP-binding protein [Pirellulaceae bacterium]|nr:ABC transporter ATP-binding protein [Pirellulaceae bacterium]
MIVARGISKSFGGDENRVVALAGVDLEIAPGERVALLGRSGSGKTTLLNLLAGLDRPSAGSLQVAGEQLQALKPGQLAKYRLHNVGVIFQSFQLLPHRTALQNVELPLILAGVSQRQRREAARDCLGRVGLSERMHHRPFQLSGGEQQRVAIARAIINRPPILLADEPTGNIDSRTADQVTQLILDVTAETNSTMVLVTHDHELAQRCVTRVVTLSDGRLIATD